MDRRYGKLENAGQALSEVEHMAFGSDAFQFWLFQKRWPSIAGDTLAKESYIGREVGTTLYIHVTNSVWMQELMMHRQGLLARVQKDPYGRKFRDMRIMMSVPKTEVTPTTTVDVLKKKYQENEKVLSAPLSEGEKVWVDQWTKNHVEKEALRTPIARLMEGALKRRKAELAAGWHPCPRCGTLCSQTDLLCPSCRIQEEKQTKNKIVLLLKDHPAYLYEDVRCWIRCSYAQFADARDILIHRYKENYYNGYGDEEEKKKLLSLLVHKPYEEITKEEADKTLSGIPRRKSGVRNEEKR